MHSSRRFAGGLTRNRALRLRAVLAFAACRVLPGLLGVVAACGHAGAVIISDAPEGVIITSTAAGSSASSTTTPGPAPGLAQPSSLMPRSSPYPTTSFPAVRWRDSAAAIRGAWHGSKRGRSVRQRRRKEAGHRTASRGDGAAEVGVTGRAAAKVHTAAGPSYSRADGIQ